MQINKSKSAILPLTNRQPSQSSFYDYPIKHEYKYLGLHIKSKTKDISTHLHHTLRKINYITYRLKDLRKYNMARLNINLFETFCLPSFKLMAGVYPYLIDHQKRKIAL